MSRTLLIAEDEPILRESLAELFHAEGFQVIDVPDGRAAYNVLLECPVDVVITDIRMPEMDGTTLLTHINDRQYIRMR